MAEGLEGSTIVEESSDIYTNSFTSFLASLIGPTPMWEGISCSAFLIHSWSRPSSSSLSVLWTQTSFLLIPMQLYCSYLLHLSKWRLVYICWRLCTDYYVLIILSDYTPQRCFSKNIGRQGGWEVETVCQCFHHVPKMPENWSGLVWPTRLIMWDQPSDFG